LCADDGRNGRDISGIGGRGLLRRGELACGEGVDEADTKVSLDKELEDLRTKTPEAFLSILGLTEGAVVFDTEIWERLIGLVSEGLGKSVSLSNVSVMIF
jgi:hypothetical protein